MGNKSKKKDESVLSLCDARRQRNKLHFCIMAPEGQTLRRVPPLNTRRCCKCVGYTDASAAFLHESRRGPFILASFCILPTLTSVVSVFHRQAELTVIIPNSIILINATGLQTMHFHESQGPQPISLDKSSG